MMLKSIFQWLANKAAGNIIQKQEAEIRLLRSQIERLSAPRTSARLRAKHRKRYQGGQFAPD